MQFETPGGDDVYHHFQQTGSPGKEARDWSTVQGFCHFIQRQTERRAERLEMQASPDVTQTSISVLTAYAVVADLRQKFAVIHRELSPTERPLFSHVTCAIDSRATSVVLTRSMFFISSNLILTQARL